MNSGTRNTFARGALRLAGTSLAALVALGLAPAVAVAVPTNAQVAQAEAAAALVEARIGEVAGALTAAQDSVDAARAVSAIALDEYQATQAAVQVAQQESVAAQAAAAQATADLEVARGAVVAFARRSYMDGSSYSGAAALVTATDPGELIERVALLEAAGSHRSDVLDTVTVLQEQAAQADETARTALVQITVLQEQAATELAAAQAAEVTARAQAGDLAARRASLEAELAAAQEELQELVGAQAAAARTARVARVDDRAAGERRPCSRGELHAGRCRRRLGGGDRHRRGAVLPRPALCMGWRGSNGPGPGQDPDLGIIGFDCSGLTQYAYEQAGIRIQRNSRAQYASLPKVSSNDLQRGDLVFWATNPEDPGTIHHVAIYLGSDKIVEAPESGSVVKVSNMRWGHYAGAVRPSA